MSDGEPQCPPYWILTSCARTSTNKHICCNRWSTLGLSLGPGPLDFGPRAAYFGSRLVHSGPAPLHFRLGPIYFGQGQVHSGPGWPYFGPGPAYLGAGLVHLGPGRFSSGLDQPTLGRSGLLGARIMQTSYDSLREQDLRERGVT